MKQKPMDPLFQAIDYAKKKKTKFEKDLFNLLRLPSISADPEYTLAITQTAKWIENDLKAIGLKTKSYVNPGKDQTGYPIITAEKIIDPKKPTVLFYGHYDVQPPDPIEQWDHPPFDPIVKNRRVYARGASDDKGQLLLHLKAVESYLKSSKNPSNLPVNVRFLIEGEEEISSPSLFYFLDQQYQKLPCDVVVISDTEMFAPNHPALIYGLRGMSYLEITLSGSKRDLHSGLYGGVVDNPANHLAKMLASIQKEDGTIEIKDFYQSVLPPDREESRRLSSLPFDEKSYQKKLGIKKFSLASKKRSFYESNATVPSFDINGIDSGYQGPGAKTIIPAVAKAKISFRLVPNQSPKKINQLVKKHLKKMVPPTLDLKIKEYGVGEPFLTDPEQPIFQSAIKALKTVYHKEPYLMRLGASIPIISQLQKKLKADVILLGFGLPEDKIHSPNESFSLIDFHRGIETSIRLMEELGRDPN